MALAAGAFLQVAGAPGVAQALEPLEQFLTSARAQNPSNKEQVETVAQRVAESDKAWGAVLPDLTAKATLTHNQYAAVLPPGTFPGQTAPLTILAQNQEDAYFGIDVPLVDLGAFSRIRAAGATRDGARARLLSTAQDIDRSVARSYFQLIGAHALVTTSQQALAVALDNQKIIAARREAGTVSDLDVDRAAAEVELDRQHVADAETTRDLAARALKSQTGITPSGGAPELNDDLHEEAPLDALEPLGAGQPSVKAAQLDVKVASRNVDAADAVLLPSLAANATEHVTNAAGFTGQSTSYMLLATASWRIDLVGVAGTRANRAALGAARARESGALTAARDDINTNWLNVRAGIVKVRATRAQVAASVHAAKIAKERYLNGAATQLDVLQADRDAFSAEVSRIQADADLALSRLLLRLGTGRAATDRMAPSAPPPGDDQ